MALEIAMQSEIKAVFHAREKVCLTNIHLCCLGSEVAHQLIVADVVEGIECKDSTNTNGLFQIIDELVCFAFRHYSKLHLI